MTNGKTEQTESSPIARGQTRIAIQGMQAAMREINVIGLNAAQRKALSDVMAALHHAEDTLVAPGCTLDKPER